MTNRNSIHPQDDEEDVFSLGLEKKEITILNVCISNFKDIWEAETPADVVKQHGLILYDVSKVAEKLRGNLVSYNQEAFTIVFSNRSHQNTAVNAAIMLQKALDSTVRQMGSQFSDVPEPVMAVASGLCYTGNIGNRSKRVPIVFGELRNTCTALIAMCKMWECKILMNDRCAERCKNDYLTRPVDFLLQQNSTFPIKVYELIDKKTYQDDEWMYEMEQKKDLNKYKPFFDAFELISEKRYNIAEAKLKNYLATYSDDKVAEKLLEICKIPQSTSSAPTIPFGCLVEDEKQVKDFQYQEPQ